MSDILTPDDIRKLLLLGDDIGSHVTLVEAHSDDGFRTIDGDRRREEKQPDPFCTFFRHGTVGGRPAFEGADQACARCEQKLARLALRPPAGFSGDASHRRCHVGLTDYQVPVEVGGHKVASVIAGRVVKADEDRERIRKIVQRLGTLTRAEAASERKHADVIHPASDKVQKRLLLEISEIPAAGRELPDRLSQLAQRLGTLATKQFQAKRLQREEEFLSRTDEWPQAPAKTVGDLIRHTTGLLVFLRRELNLEFLAFFARLPRELDDPRGCPSLVAEAGFDLPPRRRNLELDWDRLAHVLTDRNHLTIGRDSVSATSSALRPTPESPSDLKDRLTKSLFFAPVELRKGWEGALAFGSPKSHRSPRDEDYSFLGRLAGAMTRRYYALALEVERSWLLHQLDRNRQRLDKLDTTVRELRVSEKEARTTRGYTNFDVSKLLRHCIEKHTKHAAERGIELDARSLPQRLPLRAHRALLRDALRCLLTLGIERTRSASEGGRPSPLRIYLKRTQESFLIGVEAIGEYLTPQERRQMSRMTRESRNNPATAREGASAAEGSGSEAPGPTRHLSAAFKAARRHGGRFRIDSERLHRFENDPGRWMGKTNFLLELPTSLQRHKPPKG